MRSIGTIREQFEWQYCILAFAFFAGIALIQLQFMNTKKTFGAVGKNR